MPAVGEIRTNPNNPAQRARWDGRQWVDATAPSGPRAAPAWGSGAVELPNGSVVRYGPRGGMTVLKKGDRPSSPSDLPDLTEDQGKQTQNAILMSGGEAAYRAGLEGGFNPGSARNSFASFLETLPLGVGTGAAKVIRDDTADRARAAQLRWAEGSLRSRTGAAIKDDEIVREANMFFPGFGADSPETMAQLEGAREQAFSGTLARSGPGRTAVPAYPYTPGPGQSRVQPDFSAMSPQQRAAAGQFRGTRARSGSLQNPFIPVTPRQLSALPQGSFFIDTDGQVVRKGQ